MRLQRRHRSSRIAARPSCICPRIKAGKPFLLRCKGMSQLLPRLGIQRATRCMLLLLLLLLLLFRVRNRLRVRVTTLILFSRWRRRDSRLVRLQYQSTAGKA
jgi:hypothetical protein